MVTLKNIYQGGLSTEAEHYKSGTKIITDAPVDNYGKGESFSPTDLFCAALSSCMLTVMGIEADKMGVDMTGMTTEVTKYMALSPRKISKIKIIMTHPSLKANEEQKEILKDKGRNCPVALSLSSELQQELEFNF